jgi:hypothetical protein
MLEGLLYTMLGPLVNSRCYPLTFIQPDGELPRWPAIRYTLLNGVDSNDICGSTTVDTDDTSVQLDLVAQTHGAVITLRDQVIAAMLGFSIPATRQSNSQEYDEQTKTYRVTLEYLISPSSGAGSP